jgi:preprotein translocase subunit YajC
MQMFRLAEAMAQTSTPSTGAGGSNPMFAFLPFILIFVVFYLLLIVPQQKRAKKRKAMLEALKKGDKVSTSGGMIGTITNLSPDVVTLQVAEGVRIKVLRSGIDELRTGGDE